MSHVTFLHGCSHFLNQQRQIERQIECQNICQKECQKMGQIECQKNGQKICIDRPDRMSDRIPERMSEDVRTMAGRYHSVSVTVGITQDHSKIHDVTPNEAGFGHLFSEDRPCSRRNFVDS